jgi:hypothetical protein
MIYTLDITTPKNTPASSPQKTILRVTNGLVYKIEIDFPPGPSGLLYVSIYDGLYQVWPSTTGAWFHGDAVVISFDDTYAKTSAPFEFTVLTYNLDDTYDHTIQIRLGMVSKEIFARRFLGVLTPEEQEEIFKRMVETQTTQYERVGI